MPFAGPVDKTSSFGQCTAASAGQAYEKDWHGAKAAVVGKTHSFSISLIFHRGWSVEFIVFLLRACG